MSLVLPIEHFNERQAQIEACIRASDDSYDGAAFFILNFCFTVDRERNIDRIPPWPHVEKFIEALWEGEDLHVEKSRQMMITWIACAFILWELQFKTGYIGFLTSRKEKLVDDGGENSSPNSLLGRVRWLYDRLPVFVKREVTFTYLKAKCPSSDSFLVGESSNVNMGRGGTYTRAICDEWAQVPQSEGCFASLRSACARGLVLISTPYGPTGNFARIRKEKEKNTENNRFTYLSFRWTDHPERNEDIEIIDGKPTSTWYRNERSGMTADAAARELDISYAKSVHGLVYGNEFDYDVHVRKIEYVQGSTVIVGVDFGILAATAAAIGVLTPNEIHWLWDYEEAGLIASKNAQNVMKIIYESMGYQGNPEDIRAFGDPAGNAREQKTGSSVIDDWKAAGFSNFTTRKTRILDGIRAVRQMFATRRMYIHPRCTKLIDRLGEYRGVLDQAGEPVTDTPEHGSASHLMDAVRYPVVNLFPVVAPYREVESGVLPGAGSWFGDGASNQFYNDLRDAGVSLAGNTKEF